MESICVFRIQFRNDNCGLWHVRKLASSEEKKNTKNKTKWNKTVTYIWPMALRREDMIWQEAIQAFVHEGQSRTKTWGYVMLMQMRKGKMFVATSPLIPISRCSCEAFELRTHAYHTVFARWTFPFLKVRFATVNQWAPTHFFCSLIIQTHKPPPTPILPSHTNPFRKSNWNSDLCNKCLLLLHNRICKRGRTKENLTQIFIRCLRGMLVEQLSLYLVRGVSKVASKVLHSRWSQLLITGGMLRTKKSTTTELKPSRTSHCCNCVWPGVFCGLK